MQYHRKTINTKQNKEIQYNEKGKKAYYDKLSTETFIPNLKFTAKQRLDDGSHPAH